MEIMTYFIVNILLIRFGISIDLHDADKKEVGNLFKSVSNV